MTDYQAHAARAQQLLAMVDPKSIVRRRPEHRIAMAEVEARALAAAIAGRQQGPNDPWGPPA